MDNKDDEFHYKLPCYLGIKIPAKINNVDKAVQLLGGYDEILNKSLTNKNLKFSMLDIELEKFISYDLLCKRIKKRSKK